MTNPTYAAQELSTTDVNSFKKSLESMKESPNSSFTYLGKPTPDSHKGIVVDGFYFRGQFEIILRNAETGCIEWQHQQNNLMTDVARYQFWSGEFRNMQLGFMPSTEAPMVARSSMPTDPSQCVMSGNLSGGTVNQATYVRTYSYNFNTPPVSNRKLGAVVWAYYDHGINSRMGIPWLAAYSLLTPARVQTPLQTVEVVYKVSMTPVY